MRRSFRLLAPICLAATGCGGSPPPAESPRAPPPAAEAKAPARPAGTLYREEVNATVDAGLGRFLQRVDVEAALDNGQFRGFRIVSLQPPEFWRGVDLEPGDVVTSVNGMPIERETQAYDAFTSLKQAKKLEVSYLRGGRERKLVYSIVARSSAK